MNLRRGERYLVCKEKHRLAAEKWCQLIKIVSRSMAEDTRLSMINDLRTSSIIGKLR